MTAIAIVALFTGCASTPNENKQVAEAKTCRWVPAHMRDYRDDTMCEDKNVKQVGLYWESTRPNIAGGREYVTNRNN